MPVHAIAGPTSSNVRPRATDSVAFVKISCRRAVLAGVSVIALAACTGNSDEADTENDTGAGTGADVADSDGTAPADTENPDAEQRFPDVIDASATSAGDTWTFSATLSSPYDTPERYADAWRVITPHGSVIGVRELAHDHAGEQPFTRSLAGVEVPDGVAYVTIEGRDLVNGWGGATVDVQLSGP